MNRSEHELVGSEVRARLPLELRLELVADLPELRVELVVQLAEEHRNLRLPGLTRLERHVAERQLLEIFAVL